MKSAKIWHCKYRSVAPLSEYRNLRALCIATHPDDNLEMLRGLQRLEWLKIIHLPKVRDLTPIADLGKLQSLSLQTLPGWDASGKTTTIESLAPLKDLPRLRHLELFGIRPPDKSLEALHDCRHLKSARFSKFGKLATKAFYEAVGASNDFMPESPLIPD
ncbi:MAG TPA: hypothetical protein P5081_03540 [Phycisphaerae bacterium]|nr:hypothetical protein [Phycisphaerae bacterium]